MKRVTKILWGVVLIAAGVIFALNALDITDIDVFFDGWWTLFIIVPCTVGIFTEREKTGNVRTCTTRAAARAETGSVSSRCA